MDDIFDLSVLTPLFDETALLPESAAHGTTFTSDDAPLRVMQPADLSVRIDETLEVQVERHPGMGTD